MSEGFEEIFTGGDPRTLGRGDEAVGIVLGKPQRVGELFDCLFSADEIVRMRAADALEKVCRERPELLEPFLPRLLDEVAKIDQPSVRWHLIQMLGELPLDEAQKEAALGIVRRNLERADDWIVTNYALETLAQFAAQDRSLVPELMEQVERFRNSNYKSLAHRAEKIGKRFGA